MAPLVVLSGLEDGAEVEVLKSPSPTIENPKVYSPIVYALGSQQCNIMVTSIHISLKNIHGM